MQQKLALSKAAAAAAAATENNLQSSPNNLKKNNTINIPLVIHNRLKCDFYFMIEWSKSYFTIINK